MASEQTSEKQTERSPDFARGFSDGQFVLSGELSLLRTLADQMREFVQFVADHSNDPAIVAEAKRHGAR